MNDLGLTGARNCSDSATITNPRSIRGSSTWAEVCGFTAGCAQ